VAFNREIGVQFKGANGKTRTFGAERYAFPKGPSWTNASYLNGDIYEEAIGSRTISANGEEAIRSRAFELYTIVTDNPETAQEFSFEYNKRPIVTEQQYMEFVGVGGSSSSQIDAILAQSEAADAVGAAKKAFADAFAAADTAGSNAAIAARTAAEANLAKANAAADAAHAARAAFLDGGEFQVYSGGPFRQAHQSVILEHVNIIGGNDALEGF
jgi:hypothetical protein